MEQAHRQYLAEYAGQTLAAMSAFAADQSARDLLIEMGGRIVASLRRGGKLLIAGNGGSAADAQHIAAEFTGRLMYDRAPLAAIALTTDTSALTAIGNDYGYDHIFERQLRALARHGDIFWAISTSGRSPNILRALEAARNLGVATFGFAGHNGGPLSEMCDLTFRAPGAGTAIVQQIHITAAHMICAVVERTMFPPKDAATP